jgi:hypothetical protein
MAGTCSSVVDAYLLPSVAQLPAELQADFACPAGPGRLVTAEWLRFERGVVVAIVGEALIYVYYENGTWEQVAQGGGPPEAGEGEPVEGRPTLPLPLGRVVGAQGRYLLLGEALQTTPTVSETVIQPFMGGIAVGNLSGGQILFMSRSRLRF